MVKTDDVPQDDSRLFAGHTKALYARGCDGRYTTVESSGWRAEEIATGVALVDFEQQLRAARARVCAGASATLEYHMYARRMDPATLADAAGLAHWRVRRHLRPRVFARLPRRLLARYADALQLPAAALICLPDESGA